MSELESESIVLMNGKVRGTITYRDFHAPGKRFMYKKSAFTSTIVVTIYRRGRETMRLFRCVALSS